MVHEATTQSLPDPSSSPPASAGVTPIRVAVYELDAKDLPPRIATVVTDSLLAEVRKLEGIAAIGMSEIRDMLSHEAEKQLSGCEDSESCLADIAGALGVDELVTGSLAAVGAERVITVRRIDQRRATVRGTFDQRLTPAGGEEFLAVVGPAIETLFPDHPLRPERERGVAAAMALRINPPPLPRWSFWSAVGATAAASVGGILYGVLARASEGELQRTVDSATQPVSGATVIELQDRAQGRAKVANVMWAGALLGAAASGVMSLFTDWHDYRGAASVDAGP